MQLYLNGNRHREIQPAHLTAAIAERIDAKETVEDLAADYGMTTTEIEQAVLFERAEGEGAPGPLST